MRQINFNSKIIPSDIPVFGVTNRAFRYGDGIFESIRTFEGKIPFLKRHFQRLIKGADLLQLRMPGKLNMDFMLKEIQSITGNAQNARIRFTLFRKDGGFYTPSSNESDYVIEYEILNDGSYEFPSNGITMGICPHPLASFHYLSPIKNCNRLPNILSALYAKNNQLDDCLMLNQEGYIAESSSSNIFFIQGNELITPPLSSGCIDGTMRDFILEIAPSLGFSMCEIPVHTSDLTSFKEVFLTNAIQGIRPVKQIEGFNFDIAKSNVLLSAINEFVRQ